MLHLTAQQRRQGFEDIPDPQELTELARDLRDSSTRQRARKIFSENGISDDPWKGVDTAQHRM